MKAIICRYHAATAKRGARITANADHPAGKVTIPYPYEYSGYRVYRKAVIALLGKTGWDGRWVPGTLPSGDVVFVCASTVGQIVFYCEKDC